VATILAPVPPEIQPPLPGLDSDRFELREPFPRQVTTRLMSSLGLVSQAIQERNAGQLLNAVHQGISANLCDDLVLMRPPGDESSLDIRVSWARTRPRLPADVPQSVSFPQEHFPVIEEVGRQLRTRATAGPERFRGKVLSVKKALRPLMPEVAGWMVLAAEVGGVPARVKVDLHAKEFASACDALRNDWSVEVKGTIRHDVKGARVRSLRSLGLSRRPRFALSITRETRPARRCREVIGPADFRELDFSSSFPLH
jgi:hypothetical protein